VIAHIVKPTPKPMLMIFESWLGFFSSWRDNQEGGQATRGVLKRQVVEQWRAGSRSVCGPT